MLGEGRPRSMGRGGGGLPRSQLSPRCWPRSSRVRWPCRRTARLDSFRTGSGSVTTWRCGPAAGTRLSSSRPVPDGARVARRAGNTRSFRIPEDAQFSRPTHVLGRTAAAHAPDALHLGQWVLALTDSGLVDSCDRTEVLQGQPLPPVRPQNGRYLLAVASDRRRRCGTNLPKGKAPKPVGRNRQI